MAQTVSAWVVRWKSKHMSAPAFWYYKDYMRAVRSAGFMVHFGNEVTLRKVRAHNPHFMDAQS